MCYNAHFIIGYIFFILNYVKKAFDVLFFSLNIERGIK
jgi:hypothetical protein